MPPLDARSLRRGGRARAGSSVRPLEALERREVLSYSGLGVSLPELSIRGYAGATAAWGQPLSVSVTVTNSGASSINQPLNLAQGAPSTADAPGSVVSVFASNKLAGHRQILIGQLTIPSIPQNSQVADAQATFDLPPQPKGLPGAGGKIFLTYVINPDRAIVENNYSGDTYVSPQAVSITSPLPNVQLVGLDLPTPLKPGDTIQPGLRIANLGPADTATQGPLTVQIVASQNKEFGPGDLILATYTIPSLPGVATAPSPTAVGTVQNLEPGNNVITLNDQVITLPATLSHYFLGVKINPQSTIVEQGKHPTPKFDAVLRVDHIPGVPASSDQLGTNPPSSLPIFPFPLGANNIGIIVDGSTNSTANVGQRQKSAIQKLTHPSTPTFSAPDPSPAPSQVILFKQRLSGNKSGTAAYPKKGFPGGLVNSGPNHTSP